MEYYIAGGAVRDLLLGKKPHDTDYLFTCTEEEFIQRNPQARKTTSGNHPVYLLNGSEYSPLVGGSFETDLLRRDVTINALALSPQGIIHAHPQSLQDLKQRIIRPASPTALLDDPMRIFRVARLAATLPDFTLHPNCYEQMHMAVTQNLLQNIPPEQVGNEVRKACKAAKPGIFLRVLATANCLYPWFLELEGADNIVAGPPKYHDSSVLEHTARVMDTLASMPKEFYGEACAKKHHATTELAVWMALCHDLGKVFTPKDVLPHHIGHEARGIDAARHLGERLRLPARYIESGALASRLHMKAGSYPTLRPGTKVDLLAQAHAAHILTPLFSLAVADSGNTTLFESAMRDAAIILHVTLPPEWHNKGEASGKRLRELRSQALAES